MSQATKKVTLSGLQYRVVKSLGAGAGSTILQIQDKTLGQNYALKVVKRQDATDDIYINQALHEFEVAQRLNHRSLLKIYDCKVKKRWFKTDGVDLLMEYVDGRTLDEVKNREIGQLVLMFIHVASAMKHMHRRGVYHGDLKPGNILLSNRSEVKVIDFGTAWIKGQPKHRVQGTPQYMAPEQAGEKMVDDKTDIYNFGATMYRLFTGEYANSGMHELDGMPGVARRRPSPMSLREDIPGTLNETIVSCLNPNPDHRPAGFFEIKDQLVAVARHLNLTPEDLKGADEED